MGVLALGCATGSPQLATGPIDWSAADRWSVRLVTRDPDGAERLTRVRIAIVDGHGVVRTGASRWRRNLENDPRCRLRVNTVDYPVWAERVTAVADTARIDAAFLKKYGWQERVFMALWPGEVVFFRLLPRR
ncbi:MAG: hypothetical protein CL910_11200 [Deltaproteobacteria bacterium]|nr:hypothetical protein [Deltaproteobacteria bacterium]